METEVDQNSLENFQQKIEELVSKLKEKDEEISNLKVFVNFYKEELENYQKLSQRKLKAYEAILQVIQGEQKSSTNLHHQQFYEPEVETEKEIVEVLIDFDHEVRVKEEGVSDPIDFQQQQQPSTSKAAFEADRKTKLTNRIFQCETCGKECNSRPALRYHLSTHPEHKAVKKPSKVMRDLTDFQRTGELKDQHEVSFNDPLSNFECNKCGKKFKQIWYLKQHQLRHDGGLNFSCELCGKFFKTKGELTAHYQRHSDERNFQCSACSKRFKRKSHLEKHEKIHMKYFDLKQ